MVGVPCFFSFHFIFYFVLFGNRNVKKTTYELVLQNKNTQKNPQSNLNWVKPLDLTTYLQEVQKKEDLIKDLICVQLMKTDHEISQQG